MRKLYSLVLIAAGLLIGTNSWATAIEVDPLEENLQGLIAAANDGDEFIFNETFTTNEALTLNTGKHIVFTLNGHYVYEGSAAVAITVAHGVLEIRGTKQLRSSKTTLEELIRLTGTTAEVDAKVAEPYSHLIVREGVTLKNDNKNVLVINELSSTQKVANGARIDLYGNIEAVKYGIKVNGNIQDPGDGKRNYSPFVYIHSTATVKTLPNENKSVAVYSSGYARWQIEGKCYGSTALYAKSGDINLAGATIQSTRTEASTGTTTGKTSGVDAGGSGIVVESNAAYPGHTSVVISEGTTVVGTKGYAIEETVDNATSSKVESISIVGGTITGGSQGAIVVETTGKTQVVDATVQGDIKQTVTTTDQVTGEPVKNTETISNDELANLIIPGTTGGATDEKDFVVTVTPGATPDDPSTIVVTPNTSKVVTMNAYGYATFSAGVARAIKEGDNLKAYKATFNDNAGEYTLGLTLISTPIYANSGVVFIGTPNKTYALDASEAAGSLNSALKPATAWSATEAVNGIIAGDVHENAYVLSGNMMYKYEGANMKANKAYLDLGTGSSAPKRIRMVVTETEETQAVENVAPEAVKAVKFVGADGQLYIRRGEAVYTVQGQLVK